MKNLILVVAASLFSSHAYAYDGKYERMANDNSRALEESRMRYEQEKLAKDQDDMRAQLEYQNAKMAEEMRDMKIRMMTQELEMQNAK